ncbi:MAG: hypothetical protein IKI04_02025 [Bacilli bacterium]|nr:hypothetical protein [Bacilli bacterium]
MVTRNLAIKYKNLYQEVEMMLTNISEIGFDISNYQKELNDIGTKVNDNIKNKYISSFAKASYENYYSDGINLLNSLKYKLDRYDTYFKVLNSCNYIDIKLRNQDIKEEELSKYIVDMIYNLKQLVKSDTVDYDNEKHIVDKIYNTAYNLIKLEILFTGESELYQFCKNEEVNIAYFDKLIRDEISNLDLSDEKYNSLRTKIYEIKSNGINSNYFDLSLIKKLLVFSSNFNLKDSVNRRLNNTVDGIEQSCFAIVRKSLSDDLYQYVYKKSNIKLCQKIIKKRITSLVLALSLLTTGGVGLVHTAKRLSYQNEYKRTVETYSTIDNNETTVTKNFYLFKSSKQPQDYVVIKKYQGLENVKKRAYELYVVSGYNFDSAKEYYEYGLENYNTTPSSKMDKDLVNDTLNYKGEYTKVEKNTYEYLGVGFNEDDYESFAFLFLLIYVVLLFLADLIYCDETNHSFIIGNIKAILSDLKEMDRDTLLCEGFDNSIKPELDTVLSAISKYDELKIKFNELYKANKYLIDDPEELMERYHEALYDEKVNSTKKLIKEYKGK